MHSTSTSKQSQTVGRLAKLSGYIAPSLLALAVSGAYAQETTLPSVMVTANSTTTATLPSIEEARAGIVTVAGGANIVDAEQYKQGRVSTLSDALQFSPGVFIASRFGAEESRMSIRGSGLQRTFHMRGLKLLQDGVPLNLADGAVDFQAVEPLSARYVEVYRGANALQFGSTTLGGAVNFVSPSGLTAAPFVARIEAGSFGYKRAQVSAAGNNATTDWFIAGSTFNQDGFRDHAKQNTQRLSGNIGFYLTDTIETRFFLNAVTTNSELPGALTKAQMLTNPRQADPTPSTVAGNQHRDFDLYRVSNLTTFRINPEQRLEVGGFYSYKSLFHPIFQVLEQKSDDYGLNARFISDQKLFGNKNKLIIGVSLAEGTLSDDRFENIGGQAGARKGESEQRSANYAIFAENQHYFLPTTALIVGAQAVNSKRHLDDRFLADGDNSVSRSYKHISPKIGLLHELTAEVQIFSNISGSYEPPTFGELAGGLNVTPVDAQRATTIEIGTRGTSKQQWGDVRWDISLYRAKIKDELLVLDTGAFAKTINAGKTIHQGIEAGIEANVGTAWVMRANYLLNDFRFDGDSTYGDKRLAGVPRQVANGEVLYKLNNGVYFGPNVRISSSSYIDHANTLQASGYSVFGFKLGQQVSKKLSWFIDARNLADKTYAATTNVVANAKGLDSGQNFYPGEGRALYAGIELKY